MSAANLKFETIAVVGVGLIGGSIALAARQRGVCKSVIGVGRSPERLQRAVELGLIDQGITSCSELTNVDLVVVCTPVDRIVDDVRTCLQSTPAATVVTDAGSVKAGICAEIRNLPNAQDRFLGSHPLAGSHRSGFENADADLYVDRKCVLTPWEESSSSLVEAITDFWTQLGMLVHQLSPEEHDRVLALTSHLPHLGASAIAGLVNKFSVRFAATGFRDTTRVAAGDPELWAAIFSDNSEQVIAATDRLVAILTEYRTALGNHDREKLVELLTHAQLQRKLFDDQHQ